ncbi:GNAT family N-acetyltransferase [Halomontanus rarus]|uniref:GNAT family N-acetyltransferase n=1 Tax=Halomontanus rarus TaxID=3034020 RepID=UPI0023E86C10|nr:N-acetyltransferase [Halovivax sp. TS33]
MSAQNWFRTGPIAFGVREYRPGDREQILDLWQSRFGCDRELSAQWLDEVESDYPTECYIASPTQNGRILGFGITAVTNEDTEDGWLEDDYFDGVDLGEFECDRPTAVMHIGVTRPECENQGIATELWKHRLAYAREHDAEQAIGTSWHRENHVDSRVLFEKFGFEPLGEFSRYYKDARDDCPDCDGMCECDATVYWRDI